MKCHIGFFAGLLHKTGGGGGGGGKTNKKLTTGDGGSRQDYSFIFRRYMSALGGRKIRCNAQEGGCVVTRFLKTQNFVKNQTVEELTQRMKLHHFKLT